MVQTQAIKALEENSEINGGKCNGDFGIRFYVIAIYKQVHVCDGKKLCKIYNKKQIYSVCCAG